MRSLLQQKNGQYLHSPATKHVYIQERIVKSEYELQKKYSMRHVWLVEFSYRKWKKCCAVITKAVTRESLQCHVCSSEGRNGAYLSK